MRLHCTSAALSARADAARRPDPAASGRRRAAPTYTSQTSATAVSVTRASSSGRAQRLPSTRPPNDSIASRISAAPHTSLRPGQALAPQHEDERRGDDQREVDPEIAPQPRRDPHAELRGIERRRARRRASHAKVRSGGASQTRRRSAQARRAQRRRDHVDHRLELRADRIEAAKRLGDAVDRPRLLGREGPEQSIPDDQDRAVVAIDVLGVARVVHAVVRRRVQHRLERTEPAHELGVNPELVERAHRIGDHEHQRRDADHRQRQRERQAGERRQHRLAQRDRQVVVLALVVHGVRGPEQVHPVRRAVPPVVDEVDADERDDPGSDRVAARDRPDARGCRSRSRRRRARRSRTAR